MRSKVAFGRIKLVENAVKARESFGENLPTVSFGLMQNVFAGKDYTVRKIWAVNWKMSF